jgi:hypothetical protein
MDIEAEKGFDTPSDGDVLCHALIDALAGALVDGDLGRFFPACELLARPLLSTVTPTARPSASSTSAVRSARPSWRGIRTRRAGAENTGRSKV